MIHRSRSIRTGLTAIVLSLAAPLAPDHSAHGQDVDALRYESRFVEANGVRLQYMDFGGSGLPLIFVQDIHNYFEDEDPFFRDLWSRFYARFTDEHRVLATVKRGYGESHDPGWGYDVATQSEDLLGLMDALGIRRAVLVGRVPATQDLTWIAEHHPERVAGLVYLGNPVVLQSGQDPEARLFGENYARGSCDLEERGIALGGARTSWRPHFLDDETVRIDVPALRFTHPEYDRRSMNLQRLDRLDEIAAEEPQCPGHARSLEYFRALAADSDRRAALRQVLEESDPSVPIDEGLERAFGPRMRTVVEPDLEGGWPAFHDFIEPHVRGFLEEVRDTEGTPEGEGAGAVAEDTPWTPRQLQQRAALIYLQHVAFSLTGARDEGRTASDQGRRVGEIVARYKQRLLWHGSSNALLANALAKRIEPEYQVEFGWATFTLRSRYQRAARELAHYGSSMEEYVDWLEAMHDAIGPVQGYAMTARLDGEWLVETYSDLPNRKELEPATDLTLYELRPEELGLYEGVYTGTIVGDTASVEWTMRVWHEDRRLRTTTWRSGEREPYGRHLVPLAEDVFLPGWYPEEGPPEVPRNARVRFAPTEAGPAEWVELEVEGGGETIVWRLRRLR